MVGVMTHDREESKRKRAHVSVATTPVHTLREPALATLATARLHMSAKVELRLASRKRARARTRRGRHLSFACSSSSSSMMNCVPLMP